MPAHVKAATPPQQDSTVRHANIVRTTVCSREYFLTATPQPQPTPLFCCRLVLEARTKAVINFVIFYGGDTQVEK